MIDHRISRIERLLSSGNEEDTTYAALECRLAIEDIVHKKLKMYEKRYGPKLLFKHWQPTKAIKVLCQLEPFADQSHTLRMSIQDENGNPTNWVSAGTHESLTSKWISKHYHKLGSHLHVSHNISNKEEFIYYLQCVLIELKRVSSSTLDGTLAHLINFVCQECNSTLSYNIDAISHLDRVVCPNDACPAEYVPVQDDSGEWALMIDKVTFKCLSCEAENLFYSSELSVGYTFRCMSCQQKHRVESQPWSYSAVSS